jgi:hypothetical protein
MAGASCPDGAEDAVLSLAAPALGRRAVIDAALRDWSADDVLPMISLVRRLHRLSVQVRTKTNHFVVFRIGFLEVFNRHVFLCEKQLQTSSAPSQEAARSCRILLSVVDPLILNSALGVSLNLFYFIFFFVGRLR